MPKETKLCSSEDKELIMLEAKRNVLFERMQNIYERSKTAHSSEVNGESFLSYCVTVDNIRTEFHKLLDAYNSQLLSINPDSIPNYQAYTAFEDLYCIIKRVQSQLEGKQSAAPGAACTAVRKPRLPAIELMSFDGDIRNWPLFYASFKSTVHDNVSLTDADRLYYLIGKLSPKAQSVFAGVTPSAENYQVIFQSLLDRYQDTRVLASTYFDQALNLKLSGPASSSNFQLFIDKFVTAVNSLKNLKLDNLSDFLLLQLALKKFDTETIRAFEMTERHNKIPTLDSFIKFIKDQCRIFQNTQPSSSSSSSNNNKQQQQQKLNKSRNNNNSVPNPQSYVACSESNNNPHKCLCNDIVHDHFFKCPAFNNLTPTARFKYVKENKACVNCLSIKHKTSDCSSKIKCRSCNQRHHTLLHFNKKSDDPGNLDLVSSPSAVSTLPQVQAASTTAPNPSASQSEVSLCTTSIALARRQQRPRTRTRHETEQQCTASTTILLATAQVIIYDVNDTPCVVRCLLDSASQSSFITSDCFKRLGLWNKFKNSNLIVKGIGGSEKSCKGSVDIKIFSRFNKDVNFNVSSLIVERITDTLPNAQVDVSLLAHLKTLPLADADFAQPGNIDVLIGASVFPHLLLPNIVRSDQYNLPPAIETVFGYVVMGAVPTLHNSHYTTSCCSVLQDNNIDSLLKRFWELEEISTPPPMSRKDLECEEQFRATTVRDDSGRYIVALPFCGDPYSLGDSYAAALRRFHCLERKLDASLKLRGAYNDVMRDYINKGFLSPFVNDGDNALPAYYIPHHGVVREDKTSTKLRVVLDASCRTTSGQSINDILHAGPNLQGDLFNIIIQFRLFEIALSADCRQMFLNIGVRESDRRFQRIFYRFDNSEPLTVYQFNRVCFGLKSSPYHALRVVRQLIADEGDNFPAAAAVASSALYMDDIACSVVSAPQAISLCEELIQLFKRGQFDLVKWTSNSKEVLAHIPDSHKASPDIEFEKSVPHKVLGLRWDKSCDSFRFDVSPPEDKCTKRTMLSTVARLWDIMGFVAPTILYAKLLIKELWLSKCEWDDAPPDHIIAAWKQFCIELSALNQITIPRHLGLVDGCRVNLIGFADASERAYGGVVYLQVRIGSSYSVQLVCAKSKVSPVKTISVARLELCAALLLSQLLHKVRDTVSPHHSINKIYAFTDSKVVLAWIASSPHRWQTFVANRVTKIIELIPADCFNHVAGIENPADCLSRGVTPVNLLHHPLWHRGPSWISHDPSEWPISSFDHNAEDEDVPERKSVSHPVVVEVAESPIYALALRMSSWSKLLRAIVYVCRFISQLPNGTSVSSSDLEVAEYTLLRALQAVHFNKDIQNLKNNTPCSPALLKLKPFLDERGIVRVGGRLSNSDESYNYKHPCILPRHDHVVDLLVDFYHKKHLHAGPELLMSLLRQKYWILAARRVIRHRIHKCNICFKFRPRPIFPPMADLPSQRVNQVNKAFTHTGCDYAGPLQYTPVRGRGIKSRKAWLCIFTCLTTRATHIEVATDLSTVSFLAALKRFLSRRGPIQCLYTDNGTCFVGASSYLRDLNKFLNTEYRSLLQEELSINHIDWKFIPPASPHFGGCWESMVKVVKTHLFKVIGQQILSYEELLTVLAQIEALVNSRPLTALSSDPAEPSALTPAHFLNTAPLSSLPAPEANSSSLLQRHTLLDKLVQSFWQRWRSEYLHQLQARSKWNSPASPIQEGTLVIMINDNSPPLSWPLAVVEKLHTSKDGTTRVVTVKTAKGSYVRPVIRLCPLPTQ